MRDCDIYITLEEISQHIKRCMTVVRGHVKAGRLPAERIPGCKGLRVKLSKANIFLAKYESSKGPMRHAFQEAVSP